MRVIAVDHPEIPPYTMPARFKTDVAYFMTPGGEPGVPALGANEYFVRLDDARKWLDELVVEVISPLAAEAKAELELTDEQEGWLAWLVEHEIQHVRLES